VRIISNIRVPVLAPDGKPLMPTKASRARRWIKSGKAKPIKTKLGIFAVQLKEEPSGRDTQSIVVGLDPGAKYSGVAVVSRKSLLCGFNLELPDWIKQRMEKRRERRRRRRQRKKGKRKAKFLNRRGCKIPPSIKARRQMELRVIQELSKVYPIRIIAVEDVAYHHKKKGFGKFFSHTESGKNWLYIELRKIAEVRLFRGWQTALQRRKSSLQKDMRKSERVPEAHVNDAIALSALVLGEIKHTPYYFDVIRRPKYIRRQLHYEKPAKGSIRRNYGGTTTPYVFRKGDYVEVVTRKGIIRGWVSGYNESRNLISISDFEWKRIGRFPPSKIRLLNRNKGFLLKSEYKYINMLAE